MSILDWITKNKEWVFSGVGIAVVVPLVRGFFVPMYILAREHRIFPPIEPIILQTLTQGKWSGPIRDVFRDDQQALVTSETVMLTLTKPRWSRTLNGMLVIRRADGTKAELAVENGIVRDRHVLLYFHNKDNAVKNLGAICMVLSDLGTELTGFWSGWSPWSQCYACGKMTLRKK